MPLLASGLDARAARRAQQRAASQLPLVHRIARRVGRELGWRMPVDDLVGPGHEGLVRAARRFSARHGASFKTFAGYRVRGAMLDAARELPPREQVDPAVLARLPARDPDAEQAALAAEAAGRVRRALAVLPARERHLVVRVYFEGAAIRDAGSEVGVTKSWASRLHARALRRLRRALAVTA